MKPYPKPTEADIAGAKAALAEYDRKYPAAASPSCPECGSDDRAERLDVDSGSYYAPEVTVCLNSWHSRKGGP